MEDGPQILPPPILEPISRPSSTSTSASANLTQLPGISSLASSNGAMHSPQPRPANPPPPMYNGASHAATAGGPGGNMPTCQNCSTSTTPLWRRDEFGAVLCNACGLFLKLHGRPRPISLKTDVIKSRNRVKTMRPDMAPKKKQQQQNYPITDATGAEIPTAAAQAAQAARRASQKPANGHTDGDSPVSRTGTPSMYGHSLPSFMVEDPYHPSVVTGYNASGASDGRAASPMNGDRNSDSPQTHEQLIAHNSSLKTRVSELEVINELFRGRLSQLEQQEAAARRGQEVAGAEQNQLRSQLETGQRIEAQMRAQLDDSHRRENNLKRRLDELELELKAALSKDSDERPAKKPRIDAVEATPEVSTEVAAEPTVEPQGTPTTVKADPPAAEPTAEAAEAAEAPVVAATIATTTAAET